MGVGGVNKLTFLVTPNNAGRRDPRKCNVEVDQAAGMGGSQTISKRAVQYTMIRLLFTPSSI